MGNHGAFAYFERTAIGAYNLGVLTAATLDHLAEPWRGTDIDHGGAEDLFTDDGLDVDEVIVKIMAPEQYATLQGVRDYNAYFDQIEAAAHDICHDRWGWL